MTYLAGFFGLMWAASLALGLGILAWAWGQSDRRKYRSGSRWCFWRWTEVRFQGGLYLRRLHLVQTPLGAAMVHWIYRADPQPDLHDHPVTFLSWIIAGKYVELLPGRRLTWRQRWSVKFYRATDQHRIIRLPWGRTITLVLAGPRVREWGFHTPDGWIPWREYEKLHTP